MAKRVMGFGTWPSPVTPAMLTSGVVGLVDVWVDGGTTVWLEARPSEGGRQALVAVGPDGARRDVLPATVNVRSGVHEYGGGAAWVEAGTVWYVDWSDQRLYRAPLDGSADPVALTPEPPAPRSWRYADMRRSPDGRWVACVRERHSPDDPHDVVNEIVVLDAEEPSKPRVVHGTSDFVMSPRFVDGGRLRFVAWNHPNMPWNDTTLMESAFDPSTGSAGEAVPLARDASFMQPDGDLVISDRSGWWNLWRVAAAADGGGERPVTELDAEIGGPAWVFGDRAYCRLDDGRLVWAVGGTLYVDGVAHATPAAGIEQFAPSGATVTAIARHAERYAEVVRFDAGAPAGLTVVAASNPMPIGPDGVSVPTEIHYPTAGGATAHAWFYPPANGEFEGPSDATPPVIAMVHGGPTSDAIPFFSLSRQFWTSRGFALVDVNYRGSTGFGTEYRNLLDGQWGVVDVEDTIAAVRWLGEQGLVDPARAAITGGSAGGFTVLLCLARGDVFAVGASSYGVADLGALASDTHKFESRYLDRLIGPWPEARAVYDERSPINHLDALDTPLIVFQGSEDAVVPPNQSEMVVEALRTKGVECEYHLYEGEGHGFRRADTIEHQLTHQLAFFQRILGL